MAIGVNKNIFTNMPINKPKLFEGRESQLKEIVNELYHTSINEVSNMLFILGEHKMGKSSFINQISEIANGDAYIINKLYKDFDRISFDFIVGRNDTYSEVGSLEELIRSLYNILRLKLPIYKRFMLNEFKISFKKNLGFGEASAETVKKFQEIPSLIFDEFYKVLERISEYVNSIGSDGIILIFDNMDNIINGENYGSFLKILFEKLNYDNINNILIVLTGSLDTYEKLIQQNNSVVSYIKVIELNEFTKQETENLLVNIFKKENITIEKNVRDNIYEVSGGYPDIINLIGNSLYKINTDDKIDINDYLAALGYVKKIKINELRIHTKSMDHIHKKILKTMLMYSNKNVSKDSMRKCAESDIQFESVLVHLKKMGIIMDDKNTCWFRYPIIKMCLKELEF